MASLEWQRPPVTGQGDPGRVRVGLAPRRTEQKVGGRKNTFPWGSLEPRELVVLETSQLHEPAKSLCLRPAVVGLLSVWRQSPKDTPINSHSRGIWPGTEEGWAISRPHRGRMARSVLRAESPADAAGPSQVARVLLMGLWGPGSGHAVSSGPPAGQWEIAPG